MTTPTPPFDPIASAVALSLARSDKSTAAAVAPTRTGGTAAGKGGKIASVKPGTNGGSTVTPQTARVSYLNEDKLLIVPAGLLDGVTAVPNGLNPRDVALTLFNTLKFLSGDNTVAAADRYRYVVNGDPVSNAAGDMDVWSTVTSQVNAQFLLSVGTYDENGTFVARAGVHEYADVFLTLQASPAITDPDNYIATVPLYPGVATPTTVSQAFNLDGMPELWKDYASGAASLNYGIGDADKLSHVDNRFSDTDAMVIEANNPFVNCLSPYTRTMIAALNLHRVEGISRLAWTRAYGLSFGYLPDTGSKHGREYQMSHQMPSDEEMNAVLDDHSYGAENDSYIRGCVSLIACFGALHLANDHTYKANDESLKRKGVSMIQACRTALRDGEADALSQTNVHEVVLRTTCHPFGMASTYFALKNGQHYDVIAEPLRVRDSVVPPPIAKVGLVVSEMNKILALPIGSRLATTYASQVTAAENLQRTVIPLAPNYSNLHVHYGYDAIRKLSVAEESDIEKLLPLVAGYSRVFNVDENGKPIGAGLSWILQKAHRENPGLVEMYEAAFENYAKEASNLGSLIDSSTP